MRKIKILLVIDVQNDFIDGALSNKDAQAIMPKIKEKIEQYREEGHLIVFTRDTHDSNYLNTMEGKHLPYPHCIKFTQGWQIADSLYKETDYVIDKPRFGCEDIVKQLKDITFHEFVDEILNDRQFREPEFEEIELIGFCTDICVVSNALILKADTSLENTIISCDASCCAGTSKAAHDAALTVMQSCQVEIH